MCACVCVCVCQWWRWCSAAAAAALLTRSILHEGRQAVCRPITVGDFCVVNGCVFQPITVGDFCVVNGCVFQPITVSDFCVVSSCATCKSPVSFASSAIKLLVPYRVCVLIKTTYSFDGVFFYFLFSTRWHHRSHQWLKLCEKEVFATAVCKSWRSFKCVYMSVCLCVCMSMCVSVYLCVCR